MDRPPLEAPALHTLRLIARQPWRHRVTSLRSAHWLASSLKLAARCPVSGCWPSCWLLVQVLPILFVCIIAVSIGDTFAANLNQYSIPIFFAVTYRTHFSYTTNVFYCACYCGAKRWLSDSVHPLTLAEPLVRPLKAGISRRFDDMITHVDAQLVAIVTLQFKLYWLDDDLTRFRKHACWIHWKLESRLSVKILGEWTVPQLQLYAATITCVTCQAISLHQFMSEDRDRMLSKIAHLRKLLNTCLIHELNCPLLVPMCDWALHCQLPLLLNDCFL